MRKLLSVCLVVLFVLTSAFSALASPFSMPAASGSNAIDSESLMSGRLPVASGSDALCDEPLDESFSVIPYSSLGSINNTVGFGGMFLYADMYDSNEKYLGSTQSPVDGQGHAVLKMKPDCTYFNFSIYLTGTSLPSSGKYTFTADFSSDMSVVWDAKAGVTASKKYTNAQIDNKFSGGVFPLRQNSGDFQFSGVVDFGSGLSRVLFSVSLKRTDNGYHKGDPFGGFAKVNLKYTPDAAPDYSTPGTGAGASAQDFQNGVTNLMGNISDKLVEIVATISDQLKALWDQMYNYMHLEQLKNDDKNTGQIVDAINSQGEQVGQDITNSIDNNTQNIINNNNQNFDNIQNGYDNTGMGADKDKLDSAINGYDKLEDDVVNQVKDNINQFEFKNPFESFTAPMKDIGYFLTGIYNALGALNIPIGFSLTLTIALLAIGWYRFKGGA